MGAGLIASAVGDQTVDGGTEGTTETSVFSAGLGAGVPGSAGFVVCRALGDIRNDSGSGQTVRHRWKLGSGPTTLSDFTTISMADDGPTNRYADISAFYLAGQGSASAQRFGAEHRQGGSQSGGGLFAGGNDHAHGVNSTTVDTSSSPTLEWTAQLSAANSELEFRRRGVWVEGWTSDTEADGSVGTRLGGKDSTETVITTTTQTTVVSYTIPGGTLSTGNLIVLSINASANNESGTNKQWWADVFWGGTNIINATAGTNNASGVGRRAFPLEIWVGGHGSTGEQMVAFVGQTISGSLGSGTGTGGTTNPASNNSQNLATVDSTTDQTLSVQFSLNATGTSTDVTYHSSFWRVIKA